MGGDGGVIASNRKYMRGAGTANHTADNSRHQQQEASAKEVQQELMSVCYLTKAPLNFKTKEQVVADPYGRLYNKEAAVEALLRRRTASDDDVDELGSHIRGLKDLITLKIELSSSSNNPRPICPVTSVELNGVNPAVLLPKTKSEDQVNVLAERSIKEMGKAALQEEYGDYGLEHCIRLAPPPSMMETIVKRVQELHDQEKVAKLATKNKKKRNKSGNSNGDIGDDDVARKKKKKKQKQQLEAKKESSKGDYKGMSAARQRVQSAVQSNDVLSSLFATNSKNISEKERADNLFARS